MSAYVNVSVDDLQIGDCVPKLGRLCQNISDHPTLEDYVVAVFERRDEEKVVLRRTGTIMQVRVSGSDR